jgi:outer membrane protein OmpA-like peptidoglycan-associated protein
MQIEIFSLCDAATSGAGKVNILGAFDTIFAKQAPALHPQCAVVLRVRFEIAEGNEHEVAVNFIDEDGKSIFPPAKGEIKINFPEGQRSASTNLILNVQGLKLEKYGEYDKNDSCKKKLDCFMPILKEGIIQDAIKEFDGDGNEELFQNILNCSSMTKERIKETIVYMGLYQNGDEKIDVLRELATHIVEDTHIGEKWNVYFEYDSDTATDDQYEEILKVIGTIFKEDADKKERCLHIIGYTSTEGDAIYNELLSQRRANNIQKSLKTYWPTRSRASTEGRGENESLEVQLASVKGLKDDIKDRDRRVEFEVKRCLK